MIYRDLIWVAVFVQYLTGISGDTLNRAYRRRPECAFNSGEAYFGPETETEIIQALSEIECAGHCSQAADCNSFNYNSNNGSCHLNVGVVRKNIGRLSEVANYRYYEFYEDLGNFTINTRRIVYIFLAKH